MDLRDEKEKLFLGKIRERYLSKYFAGLNEMRKDGVNTDIILLCKDQEFPAHQLVLSAGSSYFRKMFESDFKESSTKTVDFSYIESRTMSAILDFFYLPSENIVEDESIDQLLKIHKLSHMFDLVELSEMCWNFIMKNINRETCLVILNTISIYGETENINTVINFIKLNLKELVKKPEFENLSKDEMKSLITHLHKTKVSPEDYFLEALIKWAQTSEDRVKSLYDYIVRLNFDLISKECVNRLLENETFLNKDEPLKSFIEFQVMPRLKSDSEIKTNSKYVNSIPSSNNEIKFLRLFYFGLYSSDMSFLKKGKDALRLITIKNNVYTMKFNFLPFLLSKGMACVEHGSKFYFIGGGVVGYKVENSPYFFMYDWQTNTITWKPNLIYKVKYPLVAAVDDRIYVIGGTRTEPTADPLIIQYFVISKQQWYEISLSKCMLFRILSLVVVRNTLYLLCEKTHWEYCLYKITDSCTFHSYLPVYTEYAFEFSLVTSYNDDILIFFRKEDRWFCIIYNPDDKLCQTVYVDAPLSIKFTLSQNTRENGILLYSDQDELYRFDYDRREMRKLVDIVVSPNDKEKFVNINDGSIHEMLRISEN